MNAPVGAVDEHDDQQQLDVHAHQYANRRAYDVGIRCFQEKVSVHHGEIHLFRCVVSGVQAPEQAHFVRQVVIDEVPQLPDDVRVDEPVPGQGRLKRGVFLKQTDAEDNHAERDESADEAICYVNQEVDPVDFHLWIPMNQAQHQLEDQQQRDDGNDERPDTVGTGESTDISCLHYLPGLRDSQKSQHLVQEGLNDFHALESNWLVSMWR